MMMPPAARRRTINVGHQGEGGHTTHSYTAPDDNVDSAISAVLGFSSTAAVGLGAVAALQLEGVPILPWPRGGGWRHARGRSGRARTAWVVPAVAPRLSTLMSWPSCPPSPYAVSSETSKLLPSTGCRVYCSRSGAAPVTELTWYVDGALGEEDGAGGRCTRGRPTTTTRVRLHDFLGRQRRSRTPHWPPEAEAPVSIRASRPCTYKVVDRRAG